MNINIELNKIAGYPEILKHIVDVSEIVNISLKGDKSYGFTVSLDNSKCINISKPCSEFKNSETLQVLQALRELLITEVKETKQIRNTHCLGDLNNNYLKKEKK